jgi:hypothetical protein
MYYLIDIHSKPPMVVLTTLVLPELMATGQRYADQVSRPLVVATGEPPELASIRPTVPDAPVVTPPGVSGVNLAELVDNLSVLHPANLPRLDPSKVQAAHSAVWDLLKALEPTAINLLIQLLQTLSSK